MDENHCEPPSWSMQSSKRTIGYASLSVTLFKPRKSTRNRFPPLGLGMRKTGLFQGDVVRSIIPSRSIFSISLCMADRESRSCRQYGLIFTGGDAPTFMRCWTFTVV